MQCGLDESSTEHSRQHRERVSALQDAHSVRQNVLLWLQDEVLALRSERSAMQTGVNVLSKDHDHNDLLAMRSDPAGNVQNGSVVLVAIDSLSP